MAACPTAILKRIFEESRPYNTFVAFREGYIAYQTDGHALDRPYGDTTEGEAWDHGANAAMLYRRALAYCDDHEVEVLADKDATWLDRLMRSRGVT
jgi:hypothetical protein